MRQPYRKAWLAIIGAALAGGLVALAIDRISRPWGGILGVALLGAALPALLFAHRIGHHDSRFFEVGGSDERGRHEQPAHGKTTGDESGMRHLRIAVQALAAAVFVAWGWGAVAILRFHIWPWPLDVLMIGGFFLALGAWKRLTIDS